MRKTQQLTQGSMSVQLGEGAWLDASTNCLSTNTQINAMYGQEGNLLNWALGSFG